MDVTEDGTDTEPKNQSQLSKSDILCRASARAGFLRHEFYETINGAKAIAESRSLAGTKPLQLRRAQRIQHAAIPSVCGNPFCRKKLISYAISYVVSQSLAVFP